VDAIATVNNVAGLQLTPALYDFLFLFAKIMRLIIQSVRKKTCLCGSTKIQNVILVTPLPFLSAYLLKLPPYILNYVQSYSKIMSL
jgi:hypothetical protein